jgi:hypothetical protein
MTLPEVIARLENTIAGKEMLLKSLKSRTDMTMAESVASGALIQFLQANLKELNAIKADLLAIKS